MKEGDLMTAKDKTKKQHFIPRVYLRSFTNKSKKCHVINKDNNESFVSSVENISTEKYLYDFDKDFISKFENVDIQLVEKTLAITVDNFWNEIIKNIARNYKWFKNNYSDIYKCIAIQMIRTPQGKKSFSDIYCDIRKKDNNLIVENLILAREIFHILEGDSPLLETLKDTYGHISIGINDTDIPFVTTDNPIITVPDFLSEQNSELMMYYPITPSRCIFLHSKKRVEIPLYKILEDLKSGKFKTSNLHDIFYEINNIEKEIREKLNPLKRDVSEDKVIVLNKYLYNRASRFVISNMDVQAVLSATVKL